MKKSNTIKNTKKVATPKKATKATLIATVPMNFKRTTVCKNIEQTSPNNYRARLSLGGRPHTFNTKSLKNAKLWVKNSRTAGKPVNV